MTEQYQQLNKDENRIVAIRKKKMPAKSKNQQMAAAIAKHNPKKLYKRNKGMAKMSESQLEEFASTPRKGLPRKKMNKGGMAGGWNHYEMSGCGR